MKNISFKNENLRLTKIGKIIRRLSIDEVPQFFNVIIGEMSIVGPRPQMQVDFDKFPVDKRNEIYKSQPGITGIGSIIFRDEEKWISEFDGDKHKFYKEKNYSAAVIRYEKALDHNNLFKEALINLSTVYMKTKLFDKALETLQAGQNQFPQEPLFYYNYACYYSLRGKLKLFLG